MKIPSIYYAHWEALQKELRKYNRPLISFSGGVDSALLAVATHDIFGKDMLAVTIDSPIHQSSETRIAVETANQFGIPHQVVQYDDLQNDVFRKNPPNHCYFCKKYRFELLKEISQNRGFDVILEGSNSDDREDYRPGIKAALELGVKSPLMDVGLTKGTIRLIAKSLMIPVWDKPSEPCIATRIAPGIELSQELIDQVKSAENFISGFEVQMLRVRIPKPGYARIEVIPEDIPMIAKHYQEISGELINHLGFCQVSLDLQGYQRGNMNKEVS
ncbi:MAG: ATP-dependent sacrificial sulfur transferase LarE [Anaerolineales bacterium]|nr:ATP-dependent sacrificial sulfur transferase LarE [Anaerolineales bacterium]